MTHRRSDARSDGVELELAALRGRIAMVEAELVAVRAARDQLAAEVERLSSENRRLQTRVGELAAQVEQLRRAPRRQAAPFSNGPTEAVNLLINKVKRVGDGVRNVANDRLRLHGGVRWQTHHTARPQGHRPTFHGVAESNALALEHTTGAFPKTSEE